MSQQVPEVPIQRVEVDAVSTSLPLQYVELSKKEATSLVVDNHYLHRRCPISFSWGIEQEGKIVGVLTIGKPCSWTVTCGLVGEKRLETRDPSARTHDVFELNRIWLHDSLPRNSESQFIGSCLRELKKKKPYIILVSFADTSMGHVGYVYQATNWIYTGTSVPFTDKVFDGKSTRRVPRTIKHRYVWFADQRDRSLLNWEVQPYPKRTA